MRARRPPDVRLSGLLLDRELLGYQHSRAQFASWLEPPRPQLTLMVDLDGSLDADGEALPDAWIGGLDDRPTVVGFGATYGAIDLKLTPVGAYTLTGMPLSELAGQCVALADVFGPDGGVLAARVRESDDWDERFDILEAFLSRRLAVGPSANGSRRRRRAGATWLTAPVTPTSRTSTASFGSWPAQRPAISWRG
jgi:hypothetical protein